VDTDFPLHLWDHLLPQAELTLNLMRGSQLNPTLSAWAQVHGNYDYNRTPLRPPPGCPVLAHEKSAARTTWSPYALDGWYTGPALDSYRCYRIWIWETRDVRVCDTVTWFPTKVVMPKSSSTDMILASLRDIAHALQNLEPHSPLIPQSNSHKSALEQLITLITTISNIMEPTPEPTMVSPPEPMPAPTPDRAYPGPNSVELAGH
jgi:hypothetical protein